MGDLLERLQKSLGTSYRITRELGGGGMSRVFAADEESLGREVALKVLPPELSAEVNSERFRREIQMAAKLQHPHIVPLLASGNADGLLYYTMPLIEGESLRARLDRDGALPIGDCIRIARDVVDALAYAHRHGVVHRDIKPDNVLIAERHAVVADFGVAKALSAASGQSSFTSHGMALGTPAYMSPEQAAADPHTDHRADIYSTGAMIYEMLAGRPPFVGPTQQAVLAAHVTSTPEQVTIQRPAVPANLATIVMRCLEKHPADRWQTADELLHELESFGTSGSREPAQQSVHAVKALAARRKRSTSMGLAVSLYGVAALLALLGARFVRNQFGLPDWVMPGTVILLLIGLPIIAKTAAVHQEEHWLTWRRALTGGVLAFALLGVVVAGYMALRAMGIGPVGSLVAAGVLDERERILVADFSSPNADTGLGPVVSEAFRIDLAQSPIVTVMQPSAVSAVLVRMQRPQDTKLDLTTAREVAIRDGVKAVVAGEVRSVGAGYVLSTRLLSAATGDVLAADRETAADSTQLIAAVDNLSKRLRERIGESLRTIRGDRPLQQVTTGSLDALRKYSQAMYATDVQSDAVKSISLLEEAIALDTGFAMAYRKLGVILRNQGEEPDRSVSMLTKAYELRDRLTDRERYLTVASYHSSVTRDREKAIAALQAILDTYPDDTPALNNLGLEYSKQREFGLARDMYRRAFAVDSTLTAFGNLVETEWALGNFTEAETLRKVMVARLPDNPSLAYLPVRFAAARGEYARAESLARVVLEAHKTNTRIVRNTTNNLGKLAILQGRLREGERLFRDVIVMRENRNDRSGALEALLDLAFMEGWFRRSPESAKRGIEAALAKHPLSAMGPLDRPYIWLAGSYAIAGDPAKARAILQEYTRTVPEAIRRDDGGGQHWVLGEIALAESRHSDAISEFIASDVSECVTCVLSRIGSAYDMAREPDSAVAVYERYARTPNLDRATATDWTDLAPIHKRLGELYEARGDRARSAQHYSRFIALWKNADPELQQSVAEARRRLATLSGEPRP